MQIMLGVAGSLSILLPEPPASSSHRCLPAWMGGKSWRCGLLAGQANNLSRLNIGIQSDGERLIINFSISNDIPMRTCNYEGFSG